MGKGKNNQNTQNSKNTSHDQGDGEKKQEEKKDDEAKKEEQKEEKSKENSSKDIVLKVYMHCEGCCSKVSKCLRSLDGVEEVVIDTANNKVVVKGKKADPQKALQRLQKKYSRNVELISPKPKPDSTNKQKKEPEKKKEIQLKVVELKMYMHCEGCANDIKKDLEKMKGILTVEPNRETSRVTVRGIVEPPKIVEYINKRLGKHAEIVKQENGEKGQNNNNKGDTNTNSNKKGNEVECVFQYPPQYSAQYIYPNQMFSDENVHSCSIM